VGESQLMLGVARRAVNEARARFGLRPLVWAGVLALLAVGLAFVPLFDVLGYDFSFALGLAAALAAVDVGHGLVAIRGRPAGAPALLRLCATACGVAAALLVLPLLISLANALRVRNCSFGYGLAFFVLLPLATVVYAAPAGVLVALAVKRRGRLVAFAVPVVSLIWSLLRLYRDPPVFAFDPFGGYFPGPIYDEALRPPVALLCFRLVNLVWIATAVMIGMAAVGRGWNPRRWSRGPLAAAVPLLAASIVLHGMGGRLQFRITRADLERALDRSLTTEHFVVHYARGAKSRADVTLTGEDLEFRYHQLRDTLGVEPKLPITVWEFPSADVKKALVGAGGTLYARPWTREIFVQTSRFPARVLQHEMAHVFAGTFGDSFFGMALAWRWHGPLPLPALSVGLIEGVAVAASAASDPDDDATVHEEARAMIEAGLAPPLTSVVGAGFSAQSGRRAYTIAGSFSTFLLATRGAEKLRALYKSGGNFTDVYRVPLAVLENEWRQFLARQPLTTRDRARASEDFRRPAIFKRVCARELAARLAEARAIERDEPARAVAILEATCQDDPSEPSYRLALAEALALAGQRERALEMLGRLVADGDVTVPLRAHAVALAAEINFVAGDYVRADNEQRRAAALATSETERRQTLARLRGLASPAARSTLGRALFGDEAQPANADPVLTFYLMTEYARLVPTDLLGPYLVGRQLLSRDPARALPHLSRACDDGPSTLEPEFVRECRRMTVDAAYRIGDFPRARTALERLAAEANGEADRLRVLDWRARVDWAAKRRSGSVAGGTP
jgi:tetratricopeptide (TPR) repeat protein